MSANPESTSPPSSSNNDNNSNHPILDNQTSIFSVPVNPSNNPPGNLPPQPHTLGSMNGGGLLGNHQPSGNLFGNQIQQQPQRGSLFGSQVQQQTQGGGLFGHPTQKFGGTGGGFGLEEASRVQAINGLPSNGTVDFIGTSNSQKFPMNMMGLMISTIAAQRPFRSHHTLDELRMKDYFNLKNNTLKLAERRMVFSEINANLSRIPPQIRSPLPILDGIFNDPYVSRSSTNAQSSTLLESQIRPALIFGKPSQITPSPQNINKPFSNQPSEIQSPSSMIQKPEGLNERVVNQPQTINSTAKSKLGSFHYELNKMLFISGLVQMMEKHKIVVPESLLDDTDFAPKLLEFMGQYNLNLPIENVPQFQVDPTSGEKENEWERVD